MHTFDHSFDFAPANDSAAAEEPADADDAPIRAMVVEDQVLIALSLIADLTALGCFVVARAATGERAIAEARRTKPDVVFMDVNLAGTVDGIEAARRILETDRTRIVFVTAYAEGEHRPRMNALKPMGVLSKPYDPGELAHILSRVPRRRANGPNARSA